MNAVQQVAGMASPRQATIPDTGRRGRYFQATSILLLVIVLVAAHRTDLHRKLGILGALWGNLGTMAQFPILVATALWNALQ